MLSVMRAIAASFPKKLALPKKRGFTLIEMSIVLVIIGLIIGGILKGQEVIAGARTKAVVNVINATRSAANTYYDRYRALPGDDQNATTRVDPRLISGDGNGQVGPSGQGPQTAQAITTFASGNQGENYQYFKALMAARLMNGGEVGAASVISATAFGVGSSLPAAPITGSGITVVYGMHEGDGTTVTTRETAHWYRIHKNPLIPGPVFTPRELANIDSQVDDGLPSEGGVRADGTPTCAPQGVGAVYTLSDTVACVGLFVGHP